MTAHRNVRKVALVGNDLPRRCGIATFTHDLLEGLRRAQPGLDCVSLPVTDRPGAYAWPESVGFEIVEQSLDSYARAAEYLNFTNVDVVCLQHEFGIFGGPAGRFICRLLERLRMPVVTTLHSVLAEPDASQQAALERIIACSARIVVMAEKARDLLLASTDVSEDRLDLIPHGIPDFARTAPLPVKERFGVAGRRVMLTFGLLGPGKGIEYAIDALPAIREAFPEVLYVILGSTHPKLIHHEGEAYRMRLERQAHDLGVGSNVMFLDRFVPLGELEQWLAAADIYVTPYLHEEQITSGTLAYAAGCGKAVVSTPYWYARELLAGDRGVLVPFRSSEALARAVIDLFTDEPRCRAIRERAWLQGRGMVWDCVAKRYLESFMRARNQAADLHAGAVHTLDHVDRVLPRVNLEHLLRLSDSTGIMQHARFGIPRYEDGYCTDDNARALILTVALEGLGVLPLEAKRLQGRFAAFLDLAFDERSCSFKNFLSFSRHWIEDHGSEDCQGRALRALGTCVGRSQDEDLRQWAARLFQVAIGGILKTSALRPAAFALLGVQEYLSRLEGDRRVESIRKQLQERLLGGWKSAAGEGWRWFESSLTYANARLPHALIASARDERDPCLRTGLEALTWLLELTTSDEGWFRPIGSNGWFSMGGKPAWFDQQPIDAESMVSACLAAHRATGDHSWLGHARHVFDWFLGHNDLGLPLLDASTGGCRDGLHEDRVNANQGAESTLCLLLALCGLRTAEHESGQDDVREPGQSLAGLAGEATA